MSKREKDIRVYCTTEEAEQITAQATRAGLSTSNYLRSVGLGYEVPSREDARARLELLKVNADLAKLGNLLKMSLNNTKSTSTVTIIQDIQATQKILKAIILDIKK